MTGKTWLFCITVLLLCLRWLFWRFREQQVLERELAVSKREEHTQGQQAVLKQLQLDLLQQYNAVVAELPKVEDRLVVRLVWQQ